MVDVTSVYESRQSSTQVVIMGKDKFSIEWKVENLCTWSVTTHVCWANLATVGEWHLACKKSKDWIAKISNMVY